MNESFVDLTYRGLSLGRRIKLTQVRPSTGYLELPSPMPVGTHVAIATDEGVQFDATVAWIHEQVAGTDRPSGMVAGMGVIPQLGAEPAAAWWRARVVLPDEESPRPRSRSRPVTVRPRSQTRPTTPTSPPVGDIPAIKADLEARVTQAAGVAPPPPPVSAVRAPPVSPVGPVVDDDEPEMTVSAGEATPAPALRPTGEHTVVDDGTPTVIMRSVDPEALGLDGAATDPGHPVRAIGTDPGGAGPDDPDDEDGGPTDPLGTFRR